jgi:hypothetical protein
MQGQNNSKKLKRRSPRLGIFTLTLTLSRKWKGRSHPHLNPLPSRERKIKERVFHREREIMEVGCLRLGSR